MVRGERVLWRGRCGGVWGPLEQGQPGSVRDRIAAAGGEGMAAQQAAQGEPAATPGAMALDRLDPIGAAAGDEAAAGAQQG